KAGFRIRESEEQVSGARCQGLGAWGGGKHNPAKLFFSIPNSLFPTPYSLFPTPYSLFPLPCSLFPIRTAVRRGDSFRCASSGSCRSREAGANCTSSLSSWGKNLASAAIVVG